MIGNASTDITGRRYGRLVVVRYIGKNGYIKMWECRCECGQTKGVRYHHLLQGRVQSCGCLGTERRIAVHLKHGENRAGNNVSPEYRCWAAMKSRCSNPKQISFPNYGGRGIAVCERWQQSFEAFLADMGRKPTPKHSIDRIDNDGNYEPGNCRWATAKEQRSNQRKHQLQEMNHG